MMMIDIIRLFQQFEIGPQSILRTYLIDYYDVYIKRLANRHSPQ